MDQLVMQIKEAVASQGPEWLMRMAAEIGATPSGEAGAGEVQPAQMASSAPRGRPQRRRIPPTRLSPSPAVKKGAQNASPRPARSNVGGGARPQRPAAGGNMGATGRSAGRPEETPEGLTGTSAAASGADERRASRTERQGERAAASRASYGYSRRPRGVSRNWDRVRHAVASPERSQPGPSHPSFPSAGPEDELEGESQCNRVWGDSSPNNVNNFMVALRALVNEFDKGKGMVTSVNPGSPVVGDVAHAAGCSPVVATGKGDESVKDGLRFSDSLFCGVAPLGVGLAEDTIEKIKGGVYVDIWSLLSVEHVSVDKERFAERDKKPKVAKTFSNWLQAMLTLAHVICQYQPGKGPELLVYINTIHSAYKLHGGAAWWRYDEDFRRRISGTSHVSWATKATDAWIQLILAQKPTKPLFQSNSTVTGGQQAPVPHKPSGSCWAFNEGNCRFLAACKFRHECSFCGGAHAAVRCFRRQKQNLPAATALPGGNSSERAVPGGVVRQVPQETGSKPS
ncbi:uncharacterized protein [Eleutherodactylus coqui]|uniref:uncharacterized protein isoform X1 n=1 Tax=Eleutherodactylus coqui TaxID=57060 RepID=UPI003461F610